MDDDGRSVLSDRHGDGAQSPRRICVSADVPDRGIGSPQITDYNEDAAFGGIRALVRAVVADMRKQGESPPPGLATLTYKGHVSLRVTPDRHRQLAMEAAEKHVSLNRLINDKLAG